MDAQPETTTPGEEKHSLNWRAFFLWPSLILLLYVLSFGPFMLLYSYNEVSPYNKIMWNFYRPVTWAYDETPLHKPLGMYLHIWMPKVFDKNGDSKQWRWLSPADGRNGN